MAQITHQPDENGVYRQIVHPDVLRKILLKDGDDLTKPDWMTAEDEWNVGKRDGCNLKERP